MTSFEPKHWTEIESCVRDDAAKLPRINKNGLEVPHWDRAIEAACKWIAGLRETVADQEGQIAEAKRERDEARARLQELLESVHTKGFEDDA